MRKMTETQWRDLDDLRKHWGAFCDADPFDGSDTFSDRMEAAGYIELVAVDDDALDSGFAIERGIEHGGLMWTLTPAGRRALSKHWSGQMREDLIERLRDRACQLPESERAMSDATLAADAIEAMNAALVEAIEVIRPFALLCEAHVTDDMSDTSGIIFPNSKCVVQAGHLRAAHAFHKKRSKEG